MAEHQHIWMKWVGWKTLEKIDEISDKTVAYIFIQVRVCSVCGYKEYDKKEVTL